MIAPSNSPANRTGARVAALVGALVIFSILAAALVWGFLALRRVRLEREATVQQGLTSLLPPPPTPTQSDKEDYAAARALASYLAKVEAQIRERDAAFERLKQEKVLSWDIQKPADIEKSRKVIREFLRANQQLTDTIQYGENLVRAYLTTAKVPETVRDSALALYAKTQTPLVPRQLRVRQYDRALGENALAVLDLLESHWGEWHRDPASGRLDFENFAVLGTFKDDVAKIETAAEEQEAAQKELVAYQRAARK